jgi:catalase
MQRPARAAALAAALAAAPLSAPAAEIPPERFVDALEGIAGVHPGARRSHAKGVCASGRFVGTEAARALSKAALFSGTEVPAVLRFSVGGGNPRASDRTRNARGLAASFDLGPAGTWDMAMISTPVFFGRTPEQVARFLEVRKVDPQTRQPDQAAIAAFAREAPETTRQGAWLAANNPPASYGTVTYWGINTFIFTNAAGRSQPLRWHFEPEGGEALLTAEQVQSGPDDFLIPELRTRVAAGPVRFRMVGVLPGPGDDLLDPTVAWPHAERQRVVLGTLSVTAVEPGEGGACRDVTFNPLVLPEGVSPSDDPVLANRAAPYAVSLSRRLH